MSTIIPTTPDVEQPVMPLPVRFSKKEDAQHLLSCAGFDEEEIEYLFKLGYTSPARIVQNYRADYIPLALDEEKFPQACIGTLAHLAKYLMWYLNAHQNYNNVRTLVTSDSLLTFKDNVLPELLRGTSTSPMMSTGPNESAADSVKIRVSDYPSFSGKTSDWPAFYEKFTSIAKLQGFTDLLVEDETHEQKRQDNPAYVLKCRQLYSILKHVCAGGIALPKVNLYQCTMDGHLAWQKLINHYYARGNLQEYAKACLQQILGLTLTINTVAGVDTYISNFEDLALKLEEAGQPITDLQKVTYFLNGIKDRNFNSYITLCHAQEYDYDKCSKELRCEAESIKNMGQEEARRSNKATSNRSNEKSKTKDGFRMPNEYKLDPELWKSFTPEQRQKYRQYVIDKQQNSHQEDSRQEDTRQANIASSEKSKPEEQDKTVSFDIEKEDKYNIFTDYQTPKRVARTCRRVNKSQQMSKTSNDTILQRDIDIFSPTTTLFAKANTTQPNMKSIQTPTKVTTDDNSLKPNLVIDSGEVQNSGEITEKYYKELQNKKEKLKMIRNNFQSYMEKCKSTHNTKYKSIYPIIPKSNHDADSGEDIEQPLKTFKNLANHKSTQDLPNNRKGNTMTKQTLPKGKGNIINVNGQGIQEKESGNQSEQYTDQENCIPSTKQENKELVKETQEIGKQKTEDKIRNSKFLMTQENRTTEQSSIKNESDLHEDDKEGIPNTQDSRNAAKSKAQSKFLKNLVKSNMIDNSTPLSMNPGKLTKGEILEILKHKWVDNSNKELAVLVKWKDFKDPIWEPIQVIKEYNPIILANYAKDKGIESQPTWKWTKRYLILSKTSQQKLIQLYTKNPKQEDKYQIANKAVNNIANSHKLDTKTGETGKEKRKQTINKYIPKVLPTMNYILGKPCIPI